MTTQSSPRLTPTDMRAVDAAIDYLREQYRRNISAQHLSVEVELTEEKLQAGIRRRTNLSVHQLLLKIRLDKAKELLINTNAPVKSIAAMIGFKDDSHFCKVFKRFEDTSPVAFRLQQAV